jgi:hypothetical protein
MPALSWWLYVLFRGPFVAHASYIRTRTRGSSDELGFKTGAPYVRSTFTDRNQHT